MLDKHWRKHDKAGYPNNKKNEPTPYGNSRWIEFKHIRPLLFLSSGRKGIYIIYSLDIPHGGGGYFPLVFPV